MSALRPDLNRKGGAPTQWDGLQLPLALAAVALIIGIYARFKSLGAQPLAVDEYYIVRSIQNVLRGGLPEFLCGGLYQRGLLLQYPAAALQWLGLAPDVAPRLAAALGSLLVLPPVFLIARRLYGTAAGLTSVALLSVSLWEIEIARFARMYAPFQAIAAWYVYYFIRYTVDNVPRAFWLMVLLSVAGIFMWEGGIVLAGGNLVAMFLQREHLKPSPRTVATVALLVSIAAAGYWFANVEMRYWSDVPPFPPGLDLNYTMDGGRGLFDLAPSVIPSVVQQPIWLAAGLIPLIAVLVAIRWAMRFRGFAACGLVAVILAASAGQFLAAGMVLILVLLFRLASWEDVAARSARPLHVAFGACALFWISFVALSYDWSSLEAGSSIRKAALFVYQFGRLPDVMRVVILPWATTVPVQGALVLGALIAAVLRAAAAGDKQLPAAERIVLLLVVCFVFAVSLGDPPRVETRYTFFLYPLGLTIAVGMLSRLLAPWAQALKPAAAAALLPVAAFGAFALSEDFDIVHMLRIDSPDTYLGNKLDLDMKAHLISRENTYGVISWLEERSVAESDVVVAGYHGLDFHYGNVSYFFSDQQTQPGEYLQFACAQGRLDRWSNLPLLPNVESLGATIPASGRAFFVGFDYQRDAILDQLKGANATVGFSQDPLFGIEIVRAPSIP